jgi:ketosteroid isomerase-like protein
MPRTKPPALAAASVDEVENAFYDAMQKADLDALMAVWADEDEISCVHPGGPRLLGHAAIRAAYEAMFARGRIDAEPLHVRRHESHGVAVHSVVERVRVKTDEGPRFAYVVATNVWTRGAAGWRLVAHHASPGAADESDAAGAPSEPATLH